MCRVVPSHKKIVSANERNEFVGSGRRTIPLHGRAHFQPTTAHAREHLFLPRSSTLLKSWKLILSPFSRRFLIKISTLVDSFPLTMMENDLANTANILIIGDSFVSRLEHSIECEFRQSPARHLMSPNAFARDALKAPREVNNIYFYGVPGSGLTTTKRMRLPHHLFLSILPKYVLLEIGGNDVDSTSSPQEIALAKFSLANEIIQTYDVQALALSTILPRDSVRNIPMDLFMPKLMEANSLTSSMLSNSPCIYFHKHKGFWRDSKLNPTDTKSWSTDGIHTNTPEGMSKYRKSVTKCLHNLLKFHHANSQ